MAAPNLSRKTLDDLQRRHLAFLEERLASSRAREDWIRAFGHGYDRLLALRIRDVLDPAATAKGLHEALTAGSVRTFFGPVLRELHSRVIAALGTDQTPLGDYVPAEARRAIDAILERRDFLPDALVRKIFEQQVVHDAIHETLYNGITQFNTVANPFFADWGLPAILKRMPIGGSLILSSMEAIRAEFDRRLEPEIRKFLHVFSRGATGQLTEYFLAKSADPESIELRKNLAAFLYSQSLQELLAGFGEEAAGEAGRAAEHVVLGFLERDRSGEGLRRAITAFIDDQGDATFGEWLDDIAVTERPNLDAWAELLWPHVETAVRSPIVREFLERITVEFYDGLKD